MATLTATPSVADPYRSDPITFPGFDEPCYVERGGAIMRDGIAVPITHLGALPGYAKDHGMNTSGDEYNSLVKLVDRARQLAQTRYDDRSTPCGEVVFNARDKTTGVISSAAVLAGVAYCARCLDIKTRERPGSIAILGTIDSSNEDGSCAGAHCGDAVVMPKVPAGGSTHVAGWKPTNGPVMAAVKKMWGQDYLPQGCERSGITARYGVLGDAPVLGQSACYGDRTKAAKRPASTTTAVSSPTNPAIEPGTDWEAQYHVSEANVMLLRGTVGRLQREMARRGPLPGELERELAFLGFTAS